MANPDSWTFIDATPIGSNGVLKFYAPITATKTFYRLVKPATP
jgi:hypothetical protein